MQSEHPGRVRGVGFGVTLGDYFPKGSRTKSKDEDRQKIQNMEKIIAKLVKKVAKFESQMNLDSDEEEGGQPFMHPPPGPSGKDSHTPTPVYIPMVSYYLFQIVNFIM